MDVIKGCESLCARAAKASTPARHPSAHKYLPELRAARIVFGGFVCAAEAEGDTQLCDRFRLLLSELDQLESDLEGRT